MNGQDVMFHRHTNVPDGIHDSVEFNEYRRTDTPIGQFFFGSLLVFALVNLFVSFALVALYVAFAWLEG
jgi:hypothetical protein